MWYCSERAIAEKTVFSVSPLNSAIYETFWYEALISASNKPEIIPFPVKFDIFIKKCEKWHLTFEKMYLRKLSLLQFDDQMPNFINTGQAKFVKSGISIFLFLYIVQLSWYLYLDNYFQKEMKWIKITSVSMMHGFYSFMIFQEKHSK